MCVVGEEERASGPLLSGHRPAVVSGGDRRIRMPGQARGQAQISAEVEQVGDRSAAKIVGREWHHRSYRVPISNTRSGPTVLPDLGSAKQAAAVSGLAPRVWLP